ncbi:MAG: BamA/TamA family outer membrane protein, partial [Bacteroidetes bacterium]|nr:BamA/TamA family outer membrane protein [Bacteroidota bacterium]
GVDNWLFQRIDNETPIPTGEDYFFQALGSPVRGFFVNARNGNSFGVANAEVRWPIFDYFLNAPIKSDFVQNFQVLGFADVGTAWTGSNPYDEENQFNQVVLEQNPITITIDNNREPIIWGYGFGLRSRVLGYFVRADWAWGVDDNRVMPRVFHLSLTTDF